MISKMACWQYSADALPMLLSSHTLLASHSKGEAAGQTVCTLRSHWLKSLAEVTCTASICMPSCKGTAATAVPKLLIHAPLVTVSSRPPFRNGFLVKQALLTIGKQCNMVCAEVHLSLPIASACCSSSSAESWVTWGCSSMAHRPFNPSISALSAYCITCITQQADCLSQTCNAPVAALAGLTLHMP